jgi:hypothetical protein
MGRVLFLLLILTLLFSVSVLGAANKHKKRKSSKKSFQKKKKRQPSQVFGKKTSKYVQDSAKWLRLGLTPDFITQETARLKKLGVEKYGPTACNFFTDGLAHSCARVRSSPWGLRHGGFRKAVHAGVPSVRTLHATLHVCPTVVHQTLLVYLGMRQHSCLLQISQ